MNLEELKALLASGAITQEQFDAMVKQLGLEDKPDDNKDDKDDKDDKDGKKDEPDLEALIQRAVDRATNKLGNDNKKLREQLEAERKKNLTAEELAKLEAEEKEKELAEREATIKAAEIKMFAVKELKKAGLDDGSETALELLELVKGVDEETTAANVKSLKAIIDKIVKAEIEKTFKGNGRNIDKGNGGGTGDNPYAKETFNLTKQMQLEATDPEKAKALKAAAGV